MQFHLIFTICVPTIAKTILSSEKECTPHCFTPLYRWGERVYPPLFDPTIQMGRKSVPPLFHPTVQMGRMSVLHSFSPSVRWKFDNVPHTLFFHRNKMGKKSVPPTLFFPIIEGKNIQRVKIYPNPSRMLPYSCCKSLEVSI